MQIEERLRSSWQLESIPIAATCDNSDAATKDERPFISLPFGRLFFCRPSGARALCRLCLACLARLLISTISTIIVILIGHISATCRLYLLLHHTRNGPRLHVHWRRRLHLSMNDRQRLSVLCLWMDRRPIWPHADDRGECKGGKVGNLAGARVAMTAAAAVVRHSTITRQLCLFTFITTQVETCRIRLWLPCDEKK